jgi:phosphatidylinositol alpha-1,6-mannosyltransferase
VLFVSKPIVPPYHDGTKCLVRDVSLRLSRFTPLLMASAGAPPLPPAPDMPDGQVPELLDVYRGAGAFSPAFMQNLHAALWLAARSRADLWHYVFAPNPRTSSVARWLRLFRRVPVIQTIASPPREFQGIDALLFGDVVVAQSEWTRERVLAHAKQAWRIEVIPPPVGPIAERSAAARQTVRAQLGVPADAPLFVFPGDIELGNGATRVRAAIAEIVRLQPAAVVVFAFRKKTLRAESVAAELAAGLPRESVRLSHTLDDVLALIAESRAVLFPVDDLWGKVDLPIVLLEAMMLRVPIVGPDRGPLVELGGILRVPVDDAAALARAAVDLDTTPELRASVVEAQERYVSKHHAARLVASRYEQLYLELLGGAS